MKVLFCLKCFDIRAFESDKYTLCKCGQMAAKWVDPNAGTVSVLTNDKYKTRIIGMNNRFLADTINENIFTHKHWVERHIEATDAPGTLFNKDKRNCWAIIIKVGESNDISWDDRQKMVDKGEITISDILSPPIDKDKIITEANSLLRSIFQIVNRSGKDTNWEAVKNRIQEQLDIQHKLMYPERYLSNELDESAAKLWEKTSEEK